MYVYLPKSMLVVFLRVLMYINSHLTLPHCIHLISLKCVRSKKNCDQKNSLTSLFNFLF